MRRRSFKAVLEWFTEPLIERPFSISRAAGYIVLVAVIGRLLMFYVEIVQIAISSR